MALVWLAWGGQQGFRISEMSDRRDDAAPEREHSEYSEATGEGRRLRGELLEQVFRSRMVRARAQLVADALLAVSRQARR